MINKSNYLDKIKEIKEYGRLYAIGQPKIPDAQYDLLYDELVEFEQNNPDLVSPDSPTQSVDNDLKSGFEKVSHKFPMLSIGKINEYEQVEKFISDTNEKVGGFNRFGCELKIDGMSLSLIYRNGVLIDAITRGNGTEGDRVLEAAKTISSIPKKIKTEQEFVTVRGECVIFKENFEAINKELIESGEKPYENARNLVSGSMKHKDVSETAKRKINFIAYSIVEGGSDRHSDDLDQLENWGFETSPRSVWDSEAEYLLEFIAETDRNKNNFKYDIDGVVIKLDDKTKYSKCGGTSKVPHWCKAFKFKPEVGTTTLVDVEFQIGRTGNCVPVAIFDPPCRLAGANIKKATLHNFDEIERLGIYIGDSVFIQRKGEIIPKVIALHEKGSNRKKINPPEKCPVCNGKVEQINDEVLYKCMNDSCDAKTLGKFKHFVSKIAMDMKGISEATLEQILDAGLVETFDQLYDITERDLLKLERMGETKASNIINAIKESKNQDLVRLLIGLGIPNCSEGTCKDLVNHFGSMDAISNASVADLQSVPGIKETAYKIKEWFEKSENIRLIENLKKKGLKMSKDKVKKSGNSLVGKTFVITGTLSQPRDHFVQIIESNGGKTSGSVSKNTSYLLAGTDCGSKLDKAEKLGVEIIDETAFMEMVAK